MAKRSKNDDKVAQLAAIDRAMAEARQRVAKFVDDHPNFSASVGSTLRRNSTCAGQFLDTENLHPSRNPFTVYEVMRDYLAYVGWTMLLAGELQDSIAKDEESK